jgi:hypothetical protein
MYRSHTGCTGAPGILLLLTILFTAVVPRTSVAQYYEGYYLFNGAYPDNEGTPYADEFQGLTHDRENWFLASNSHTHQDKDKHPQLWKVPVQYALKDVTEAWPGVLCRRISETPLDSLGYSHFGDISYYERNGVGYVLVPVEYESRDYTRPNVIAVFQASDLAYVDKLDVPDFPADNDPGGRSFGWIAVDTSGYLYASGDGITQIYKFWIDWNEFPYVHQTLFPVDTITLLNEKGATIELGRVQGGAFSESGRLLYLVTGTEDQEHQWPWDGINVFDTKTWRRVIRSTNGSGYFNYKYDWGFSSYNEPEGITIWDVDQVSNADPSLHGQLHVGMLNNQCCYSDPCLLTCEMDNVTLYHYINTLYVNPAYSGEETGEPHKPFKTLSGAYTLAWNGARIKIQTGSYSDVLTFEKQIQLQAMGGAVRIEGLGELSLTTSAKINLYDGGTLKLYGQ